MFPSQRFGCAVMNARDTNPISRNSAATAIKRADLHRASIRNLLLTIADASAGHRLRCAAMVSLLERRPERNISRIVDTLLAAAPSLPPVARRQLARCISRISGERWFPCRSCGSPVGPDTGYCCVAAETDECWGVHCPYCGTRAEYDTGCRHYFARTADDDPLIILCKIKLPDIPKSFPKDTPATTQELRRLEQDFPSAWTDADISSDLWWLWCAARPDPSDMGADTKWDLVLRDAFTRATPHLEHYDWPPPEADVSPGTGGSSYYFARPAEWRRAENTINNSIGMLGPFLSDAARRLQTCRADVVRPKATPP